MLGARQKRLDHTNKSATNALKTASKRAIRKTVYTIGDLTGNKVFDNIKKNSAQNNSDTDSQPK